MQGGSGGGLGFARHRAFGATVAGHTSAGTTDAGVPFDEDLVTVAYEFVHARRRDRNSVLVVLDLAWNPDLHAPILEHDTAYGPEQ